LQTFPVSSLRQKAERVAVIVALGAGDRFKLVHDTFHHTFAGGGGFFPEHTGIVHILAVVDPSLPLADPIDSHDRLGNVEQIAALLAAGYDGMFSYACFAPETQAMADPYREIKASFDFVASQLQARAARWPMAAAP